MSISFSWKGYNSDPTVAAWTLEVGASNVFGFYGASFGTPIQVGQYNATMHIRASVSSDTSDGALTGLQYKSTTEVSINGSETQKPISELSLEDCIKVTVTSNADAVEIVESRLYAYNTQNVSTPPSNLTFKSFAFDGETAPTTWQSCGGRDNKLLCGARTSSLTHDFYIGMSISPTSTGASTLFVVRFEADVQ